MALKNYLKPYKYLKQVIKTILNVLKYISDVSFLKINNEKIRIGLS
mgnify:CR=1 FL=1